MNKSRYRLLVIIFLLVIVLMSFFITYFNDVKYKEKIKKIKSDVLLYLEDKYNEKFSIIDFSYAKNTYDTYNDQELVTKNMENSLVYTFKMSSSRLIEFDVIYVVYEDDEEYIKYKSLNILDAGIYENYIYEYKIRDIKKEVKNNIYDVVNKSKNLSVYIDYFKDNNTLMKNSLDSESKKEKIDNYNKLNKKVSNFDWYQSCIDINDNYTLVFDLEVDGYITEDNLDKFKDEVLNLVNYLESLKYFNYEINFSFKNYVKANASKYLEEDDDIYLIFDYKENYSDVLEKDRLTAYIIKK